MKVFCLEMRIVYRMMRNWTVQMEVYRAQCPEELNNNVKQCACVCEKHCGKQKISYIATVESPFQAMTPINRLIPNYLKEGPLSNT